MEPARGSLVGSIPAGTDEWSTSHDIAQTDPEYTLTIA